MKLGKLIAVRKFQMRDPDNRDVARVVEEETVMDWTGREVVSCPACKGKGCERCRATGRSYPPHHLQPLEGGERRPKPKAKEPGTLKEMNQAGGGKAPMKAPEKAGASRPPAGEGK